MIKVHYYLDVRGVADGSPAPLKLDFAHKYKHAQLAVGVRVLPSQWDAKAQKVRGSMSDESTNLFLLQTMARVSEIILKLTNAGDLVGLSAVEVKNRVASELRPDAGADNLFLARFRSYASLCKSQRTREIYQVTIKKVLAFDSHAESLSFEMVSKDWLSRFEAWLGSEDGGCPSVNARSIHLRNVRAVFNDAIDNGVTAWYPFRTFKVKTEATKKRAVAVEVLRSLFSYPVTWQEQYVDAFKLSFCLIGINLVDLLALNADQLVDGRLSYRRSKTGRLYDIKVEPEAAALIEKYHGHLGRLVSWGENRKHYTTFTYQMCRGLKSIGSTVKEWRTDELGVYREVEVFRPAFPMLSSYVARHSWATIAASLDVPKDVIAHALGHGGSSVTDIYIDFDLRKVDEANRRVLDWVFYGKK
ncbi:site-specific integrase [Prevotella sp. 885]|uniref:site-specific integrase n=1 Tax=Prevotella sp. 885 TaxID=2022527 RepID=UPI000BA00EAF|nr:hypothetical protein CHL74_01750 [Prevotella sp. 885]